MKSAFKILLLSFIIVLTSCKSKYPALENGLYADIQTNKGDILLKLHHNKVPMTVANFVALAEGNHPKVTDSLKGKRYYDGTKFHRVIKDFMIQGGDYYGTGAGNAGYKFADEFSLADDGKLAYKHDGAGVLSMANSGPATNSSQFFITHKDTPWLDGKHTVFGKVQIGQNIVDTIVKNDVINRVDIIRVGKEAKNFNAAEVFTKELANVEVKEKKRQEKLEKAKEAFRKKMGIDKAIKTTSGLKYLQLQKGNGKKVNSALPVSLHYTVYAPNGTIIDSSLKKGEPLNMVINQKDLIAGMKEGIKLMEEGEKARLFVPYYLGYGEKGLGPIPPKANLIFEVEILKVGK